MIGPEITHKMALVDYFKYIYENTDLLWNVEAALSFFGSGKSNEGTVESKGIRRYYVEPSDKRFKSIYLNFGDKRNIQSIVWFCDSHNSERIILNDLVRIFGHYSIQNVIYDETTAFFFKPNWNPAVQYLQTSVPQWIERRLNGTLYYRQGDEEIEVDGEQRVLSLILKIKDSA